jgi:hypothetical protein
MAHDEEGKAASGQTAAQPRVDQHPASGGPSCQQGTQGHVQSRSAWPHYPSAAAACMPWGQPGLTTTVRWQHACSAVGTTRPHHHSAADRTAGAPFATSHAPAPHRGGSMHAVQCAELPTAPRMQCGDVHERQHGSMHAVRWRARATTRPHACSAECRTRRRELERCYSGTPWCFSASR